MELYLVWTALSVPQGQVGLLLDAVQVFMKPIQQEGQQLLGVLLLVARELGGKTSHLRLGRNNQKYDSLSHFKGLVLFNSFESDCCVVVPNDQEQAKATHFEGARSHVVAAAQPHLLHQVSVRLGNLAPHAQRIFPVDLGLILVVEEVLGERRCVAQALGSEEEEAFDIQPGVLKTLPGGRGGDAAVYLEGRVHETRVAQITEPTQARL